MSDDGWQTNDYGLCLWEWSFAAITLLWFNVTNAKFWEHVTCASAVHEMVLQLDFMHCGISVLFPPFSSPRYIWTPSGLYDVWILFFRPLHSLVSLWILNIIGTHCGPITSRLMNCIMAWNACWPITNGLSLWQADVCDCGWYSDNENRWLTSSSSPLLFSFRCSSLPFIVVLLRIGDLG